ncbi:hypothetical protein [Mesobacillus foraminis]|uniref:hypothetical protein n=1 Tax=Mesobacillus foraminis TaxID=279826 RepID=UPI000EF4DB49|nr:hypothetical protein [Mesobacillus foraminis]MBT2755813.1 hypothetical protein [Mesobacillus foraminis]
MRVNLTLVDGTSITNVYISKENRRISEWPYLTKEGIRRALSRLPQDSKFFCYQNEFLLGKLPVNRVKEYQIINAN